MNRQFLWLMAVVLCLSLALAACSGSQGTSDTGEKSSTKSPAAATANSNISAKGAFPITKTKMTLTVMMMQDPAVLDYNDNALTKYLEDKTNVHIEWQLVPAADWNTKLNLLLASGSDLPDVIMGGVTNDLLAKYGSQGIFQPLNSLIDKDAVEFPKVLPKEPGLQKLLTAPDGKIYGLPKIAECYNCTMSKKMWINNVFLKNVGLSVPQTTDDFYQMLKAFKEKDPNKNGKADEIPLIGATTGWETSVTGFLMNAFIQDNGTNHLIVTNDKIEAAFTKPEWKQGLAYLKKLADEKLLDPVSFTQKAPQLVQLVENKDAELVGAVPAGGPHVFANVNGERKKDYVAIPPLQGPGGVRQAPWNPYAYIQVPAEFVLTSACKGDCADIAVKWADLFYSEDVSVRSRLGVPGTDWKPAPAGSVGVNDKPAKHVDILQWGAKQKSHWQFINPGYYSRDWTEGTVKDAKDPFELQYVLTSTTTQDYEPYKQAMLPPLYFTPDEASEFNKLNSVIGPYVNQSIARFILGDLNLDKDWDNYLKQLDTMGLKRYLEIAQKVYDRQWK